MNYSTKILSLLLCCSSTQPLLPVIISTTILSKKHENGIIQRIVLLGDRHMFLNNENPDTIKKITAITAEEQRAVIACAQKFNALVIAEDLQNVNFTGFKSLIKRWTRNWILHKSNCSSYLIDLTKKCEQNGILCINSETRADALICKELVNKANLVFFLVLDCAAIIKWQLKNEQLPQHMNAHFTKYLLLASAAPLLFVMPFLYDAYRQNVLSQGKVNSDSVLKKHLQLTREFYKKTFSALLAPTLRFAGWQVDAENLSALHNNQNTETIFVCAGQVHTGIAKRFLEEQGYTQNAYWENSIAQATNFMIVNLDDTIDIESFITTNLSQPAESTSSRT